MHTQSIVHSSNVQHLSAKKLHIFVIYNAQGIQ